MKPAKKTLGEKTKEIILKTALDLFPGRGFEVTTMRDIAKAAGSADPVCGVDEFCAGATLCAAVAKQDAGNAARGWLVVGARACCAPTRRHRAQEDGFVMKGT